MSNKPLEQTLQLNDGFTSTLDKINRGLESTIKNFATFANLGNQTINFNPQLGSGFEQGIQQAKDDLATMRSQSEVMNMSGELEGLQKLDAGIRNTYANYQAEIQKTNDLVLSGNTQIDLQSQKLTLLTQKLADQQAKLDNAGSGGNTLDLELSMNSTLQAIERTTQSLNKQQDMVNVAQQRYHELSMEASQYESLLKEVERTQRAIADSPIVKMDQIRAGVVGIQTLKDEYRQFKQDRANDRQFQIMAQQINGNVGALQRLRNAWGAVSMRVGNANQAVSLGSNYIVGQINLLRRMSGTWAYQNTLIGRIARTILQVQSGIQKVQNIAQRTASTVGRIASGFVGVVSGIGRATLGAIRLSSKLKEAETTQRALNTIAGLLTFQTAVNGIQKVFDIANKVMSIVDESVMLSARLSYLQGEVADNTAKIMRSANASRSAFQDTAQFVSRMAMNAGDAFDNTDQIIAFSETLNKMFRLGGATAQEQASSMLQLSQAMGQGVLQGQELRSVLQGAPMVAQAIAKYLNVSVGELKDMGAEGELTAQIVRNALLSATSDVNEEFKKLPRTWESEWTRVKNASYEAFMPVMQVLNDFINSDTGRALFDGIINGLYLLAQVAQWAIGVVQQMFAWLQAHIEAVKIALVIVLAVMAVLVAYFIYSNWVLFAIIGTIALIAYALSEMGYTGIEVAQALMGAFFFLGAILWNIGVVVLKVAQTIGIAFIGLIVILLALFRDLGTFIVETWENIKIGASNLTAIVAWGFKWLFGNIVASGIDAVTMLVQAFDMLATGFQNVLTYMWNMFKSFINTILTPLNKIRELMGDEAIKLEMSGFNEDGFFNDATKGMQKTSAEFRKMAGDMPTPQELNSLTGFDYTGEQFAWTGNEIGKLWGDTSQYKNPMDSYQNGADFVGGLADKFGNMWDDASKWQQQSNSAGDPLQSIGNTFDGGNIDSVGEVGKIKDDVKITDEDLKYLRDVAERRFTVRYNQLTPQATVNYYGAGGTDEDVEALLGRMETMISDKSQSYLG